MDRKLLARIMAGILVLMMLLSLIPMLASAEAKTFVVEVSLMDDKPKGTWKNGDTFKCGTDSYFTVFCSETTRIDGSEKDFSDGYHSSKRLNFNSNSVFGDQILNAVQFKTTSAAKVTVWFVSGGDGREVAIFDQAGNVLQQSGPGAIKNLPYIAQFELSEANTYYIANIGGNNNYVKIEVTEENPVPPEPRTEWAKVAEPKIASVKDNGEGQIEVTVKGVVGAKGGDEVLVTMHNKQGAQLDSANSVLEKDDHTLIFTPGRSGEYTFKVALKRYAEEDKLGKEKVCNFELPLAAPTLSSATSKGAGTVELVFTPSLEAECYEIRQDGKVIDTTTKTTYLVEGLTVGQRYAYQVAAVRGKTKSASGTLEVTATEQAQAAWGFTYYGPSINAESNGYVGSVNDTGSVTVFSENGRGKIVPASVDGLAFYYTAVPYGTNFTLRAKVTVDSWTYSNGQEGFGLMVADRLGAAGDSGNFWNNQYMAVATKIEYKYETDGEGGHFIYDVDGPGTKYTMKLGLGTIAKTGVTLLNLKKLEANDTATVNNEFVSQVESLEWAAGEWGKDKGTYNIIGNFTAPVDGSIEQALLTQFDLEIQKNNTGYFITYYGAEGQILYRRKFYEPDALNQLDSDYVYAGFFAARNARATFSDVRFTTIAASEDAPAEEKPVTKIAPNVLITSSTVTTDKSYPLAIDANVSGFANIYLGNTLIAENMYVLGGMRNITEIQLPDYGETQIRVQFTPDPNQDLGKDTVLESTDMLYADAVVVCNKSFAHRKTIYVAPDGQPNGDGTKEHPFDIFTAVDHVTAGQTIVLMEGEYHLRQGLRIQRGMDGTQENPIRMIADPEAKTRPVLDFQGVGTGITHGGDWWYFAGFDVTNSQPTQKGFQVSGDNNILDQIHAYRNGNTGIQISRYSGADLFADWPSNNLILNCESCYNADPGEEDADGFAAKLTCGEGNVFDGCVAHHNADDGWDLYAKVETGSIGAVTIRNCLAYANGIRESGEIGTGNGNGFKMGGESISGKHVLENSFAWGNKAKGIDSNSCPDIIVRNCVAYNNGSYNVALYTNNAGSTDFSAANVISWRDATSLFPDAASLADNLKPKGSQDEAKFKNDSCYYWTGNAAQNAAGVAAGDNLFENVEFKGVARKEDGSLDLQGFLQSEKIAIDRMASKDMTTLEKDEACTYGDEWLAVDHTYHWVECECGNRGKLSEHKMKWVELEAATEEKAGKKQNVCSVCGYKGRVDELKYGEKLGNEEASGGILGWILGGVAAVAAVGAGAFVALKKKKAKADK